jgi:hypothetical protein
MIVWRQLRHMSIANWHARYFAYTLLQLHGDRLRVENAKNAHEQAHLTDFCSAIFRVYNAVCSVFGATSAERSL